ncbi:hypothetical protein ACFWN1_26595 [Streptomyces sp. NPDC058459]|uniref:hypothetical protein n=1 Tax=Streptomyces sp. NPDC058459 TaxID=3346508 RepID=UPI00365B8416
MAEGISYDLTDSPWGQALVSRILAAHSAGDAAEVTRLSEYAREEGDPLLVHFIDQRLAALRSGDSAALRDEQMARSP